MRSFFLRTAGIGVLVAATATNGAIRHVDPGGSGTAGGTTWATAYTTLPAAIAAASDGDTILMAQGTYKPTSGSDQTISFVISKELIIIGGHAGLAANPTPPGTYNPTLYPTILSGDINTINTHADNSQHVVKITEAAGSETSLMLDSVTVRHGYADGTGNDAYGGGIFVDANVTCTIRRCTIENCNAQGYGGGVYVHNASDPRLRVCIIRNNTADSGAGFACGEGSSPVLLNCTLDENTASIGGGAYTLDADQPRFICCTISANTATGGQGGGVLITRTSGNTNVDLLNCLIIDNVAVGGSSKGGGASFNKGLGGVVNCTFDNNSAASGGGYYQFNVEGGNSMIENCIFWNNGSSEIRTDFGTLTVRHCDVHEGESAISAAGGGNAFVVYDGNDFDTNNIDADPLYASSGSDWHLQCGSPCVNLSDNASIPDDDEDVNEIPGDDGFATPDRDLSPRIVAEVADAGAYEAAGICCNGNADGNGVVNVLDLLEVINGWGANPTHPGNVAPNPCPDGDVDVLDLLAVINGWGTCPPECPGEGGIAGGNITQIIESVEDCQDAATEAGLDGEEWNQFVAECIEYLCQQQIIDCD